MSCPGDSWWEQLLIWLKLFPKRGSWLTPLPARAPASIRKVSIFFLFKPSASDGAAVGGFSIDRVVALGGAWTSFLDANAANRLSSSTHTSTRRNRLQGRRGCPFHGTSRPTLPAEASSDNKVPDADGYESRGGWVEFATIVVYYILLYHCHERFLHLDNLHRHAMPRLCAAALLTPESMLERRNKMFDKRATGPIASDMDPTSSVESYEVILIAKEATDAWSKEEIDELSRAFGNFDVAARLRSGASWGTADGEADTTPHQEVDCGV